MKTPTRANNGATTGIHTTAEGETTPTRVFRIYEIRTCAQSFNREAISEIP
jgi:hypothetical protein